MEVRGNLPEQFRHSDRIFLVGGKFLFLKTVLKGQLISKCLFGVFNKQKSYKGDRLHDSWLTGITRSAGSCNLVTLWPNIRILFGI